MKYDVCEYAIIYSWSLKCFIASATCIFSHSYIKNAMTNILKNEKNGQSCILVTKHTDSSAVLRKNKDIEWIGAVY